MDLRFQPKQSICLNSDATEILYGGAAGGGKSHSMRSNAILWCTEIPGLQVYLFRRKNNDLVTNHMEGPSSFPALLDELIQSGHCKITYNPVDITFWNGSKIFLRHCQHEKDRFNYQGGEIHVLMIDELTLFTEKIYRFLRSRVRMIGVPVPEQYKGRFPRIQCGSNPGNIGHNWVKAAFIDPVPPMEIYKTDKKDGGFLRQYIPARLEDNAKALEDDPDYGERLEGLGSPELVRAMKEGDWDIVAGGAFDDVWSGKHHIKAPFFIPASWYIDRSFDWGSSKPYACNWWAESDGEALPDGRCWPKGTLFKIAELYGWNGTPNNGVRHTPQEIAREIKEVEIKTGLIGRVAPGPADSSIFSADPGSKSIAEEMDEAFGGVLFVPADKSPGSRVRGLDLTRSMLKEGKKPIPEAPALYFFSICRHSIRCLPVLPRDENKPDDVDSAAEDHDYDAIRYRVTHKRRIAVVEDVKITAVAPVRRYKFEALGWIADKEGALQVWQEPSPQAYIIGVHPQATRHGAHVATVILHGSGVQVAQWRGNCEIDAFAKVVVALHQRYNGAWVIPESETAPALIQYIVQGGCRRVFAETEIVPPNKPKPRYGFRVTEKTLEPLIETMAAEIRNGTHGIKDAEIVLELKGIRKGDDGIVVELGYNRERVIARALAGHARTVLPKPMAVTTSTTAGGKHGAFL